MYKTIRHGENSLQYTILPQNDDFRIEGKLTSAEGSSNNTGGSSSGGGSSKSRSSSGGGKAVKGATRRRSFFAYLGLIFVCTVIVGAVLIPFLVSAECLPSPTEWFLKTKAALINSSTSSGNGVVLHKASETNAPANVGVSAADKGRANANIGKTVRIINQNGVEKFILKVNKTTKEETATFKQNATLNIGNGSAAVPQRPSLTPPLLPIDNEQQPLNLPQHQISEVRFETVDQMTKSNRQSRLWPVMPTPQVLIVTTLRSENNRSAGQPTTTTTRTTPPLNTNMNTNTKQIIQSSSLDSVNVLNAPRVPAYANQSAMNQSSSNGIAPPTITTRIIQVPLLKSAAKKPIIPPILAKANSQSTTVLGMNVGSPPAVPALQTPQAAAAAAAIDNGLVGGVAQNHEISTNNGLGGKRSDWMNAHWSYINPSTYFQDWTGHKAEDSVLLPALLGFALIGMILIITVCLVARNKRTIVSSVRKRNRNDIEEQGAEDNATLLTTTNMSDDD